MRNMLVIGIILLAGCTRPLSEDIEGLYTRESMGEFSKAFDTLIIYHYDETLAHTWCAGRLDL